MIAKPPRPTPAFVGGLMFLVAAGAAGARAEPVNRDWAQPDSVDPFAAYGESIRFRVLRDGEPVGQHTVRFERRGEDLVVRSRFQLEVKVLFVTAYRFSYASTGTWRDGKLVSLSADINDDGKKARVVAEQENGTFRIEGPKGVERASLGIFPTNHWHPGVLDSTRVLNTITGGVNTVQIIDQGPDQVTINGRTAQARHFIYTGDLQNNVWYDADGRWVKMRFQGKDGSTIDYVCEQCRRAVMNPA